MSARFLLVEGNGHVRPIDGGQLSGRLAMLAHLTQQKLDSVGNKRRNTHKVALRLLEQHFDEAMSTVKAHADAIRTDDFDPTLGMFSPRDLTHRFARVLEEKMPPLNSQRVFPINTEPPPGTLRYEQFRTYSTGEAIVYRGGSGRDIPEVAIGQASFSAPIVYLVSKASIDWLENLRSNMTGLDTQTRKMRAARRAIDELENHWAYNGSVAHGLFGLLNHPFVDTAVSLVEYVDATDADDIASDFSFWANYAENESGSTFQPDTLQIAPKLFNYLSTRRYGDNADKSLLQWLLDANPHITRVEKVRELNDVLGDGQHAIAFTRNGVGAADASAEIVKSLTPTLLPTETRALSSDMFLVSGFGGLNQREAGDNLIVHITGGQ